MTDAVSLFGVCYLRTYIIKFPDNYETYKITFIKT